MEELFNDVCTMYGWTHSVNETAKKLGISTGKVRKILITEGYDMGYSASKVKELYEKGESVTAIAQKLQVSEKTVLAYIPYSKGVYNAQNRSGSALRSERYRTKRLMLDFSDRVLNPGGDYPFVSPSSRDILVYGGFFQFNLSKLISLSKDKELVPMPVKVLTQWIEGEPEFFDEPPIVLEFNPTTAYSKDFTFKLCTSVPQRFYLINCQKQALDAKLRGDEFMDVHVFKMEEYLPFITQHFREFARYWNEKLSYLLELSPLV